MGLGFLYPSKSNFNQVSKKINKKLFVKCDVESSLLTGAVLFAPLMSSPFCLGGLSACADREYHFGDALLTETLTRFARYVFFIPCRL